MQPGMKYCWHVIVAVSLAAAAHADGIVIDKVYHPYVDALEQELEYRLLLLDEQPALPTPAQLHQLSLGTAIGSRVFTELYLTGEKSRTGSFRLEAWEAEVKWQLTEQGEYAVDAGLLFEYEAAQNADVRELTAALLLEKEWGLWSGAANLRLIDEWGDDIEQEMETAFAAQVRYRWRQALEPGIEVYVGEGTRGAGPVLQGRIITGVRRNLHWEAGLILELDDDRADKTWRFLWEYEF